MSDKVKDALDRASSLRFPENVLADEVRRLTAALSEAQRERDDLGNAYRVVRESCREERNAGNGGCGCCTLCNKESRERAEKAEVERDAAVTRAEEAERFQLDAEKAYCGSAVFTEVLEFFEQAGCGKPGTPNTVWAMTQEIIRRAEAAESRFALAGRVVEAADNVNRMTLRTGGGAMLVTPRATMDALRAAVAEYRKAVGK